MTTADLDEARDLDATDEVPDRRSAFAIPAGPSGRPAVYLAGNSLGLQPHTARAEVDAVLADWGERAVDGHFEGSRPWYRYDEPIAAAMAGLVGAAAHEVAVMGTLTANLHLLMASFYRPTGRRTKLVVEASAFPSDRYAVQSQVAWHGLDPETELIELTGDRDGRVMPAELDLLLERRGDEIALVMLGGVDYYSGHLLDLAAMAQRCRSAGVTFGVDLAHAAGNVELALHDWGVDFAAWCTYKYLNAGPGSIAAIFVHERHGLDPQTPRLAGWWGNDPERRFDMDTERVFTPRPGADGWKLSNPPILSMAPLRASLEHFVAAGGMGPLRERSVRLTAYLERLLTPIAGIEIITPEAAGQRGAQLSVRSADAERLQRGLAARGVIGDFRRPDVVRLAPAPLYNTHEDLWRAAEAVAAVAGS